FYLGIDFVLKNPLSPQQEIQQQLILEAYPEINKLALKGSESPALLAENTQSVRIHSIGGQKSTDAGQDLAKTLFEQFDLNIKANPDYSTEKKGQPTTFYLTAGVKVLRLDNDYSTVNTVIAIDANVFSHCNPLAGLTDGGTFIIQSALSDAKEVWRSFPGSAQKTLAEKQIKVFFIDAVKIALEESDDLNSQFDLQHKVFKSVFFKITNIAESAYKTEDETQAAIDNNLELVKSSYSHTNELLVAEMTVGDSAKTQQHEATAPLLLQQKPANDNAIADIHRFWNQTGSLYANNQESLADPFVALGVVPASTGVFGDMTPNRTQHPIWIPENCTACGNCYNTCPDSAIPGLINTVNEVFETNIKRIEKSGHPVKHLRRAIRTVEKKYH
ncbi:MAG: 2-oxoacid:acceptor oxidoreductase family protein, partial [Thiotrichaceae bacterium]|nr:2-oxoacid:acceptor oxidoreductase family protein [Thiotrichaceae bacterium]